MAAERTRGEDGVAASVMNRLMGETSISSSLRKVRFRAGSMIYHAGEPGETCYFIGRGRAAVLSGVGVGEPITLNILGPGDSFGELALLRSDHARTASVQALETLDGWALGRSEFMALRAQHRDLDDLLLEALANRVHALSARLTELSSLPKSVVVHRCVLRLGHTFDVLRPNGVIPLSQPQVASVAGVGLRTTSAVLSQGRADGLFITGRRQLTVVDWDGVRRRGRISSLESGARTVPGL